MTKYVLVSQLRSVCVVCDGTVRPINTVNLCVSMAVGRTRKQLVSSEISDASYQASLCRRRPLVCGAAPRPTASLMYCFRNLSNVTIH